MVSIASTMLLWAAGSHPMGFAYGGWGLFCDAVQYPDEVLVGGEERVAVR